ncbi:MAG: radical SAM protein [Polyangiaceae bacterium]
MEKKSRRISLSQRYRPAYVVWELTLRCDQPCTHCGSRAGDAREGELDTEAALAVVDQLRAAGTDEVVLIGGEAYLHPGFLDIARALEKNGIRPMMTTGGRGITRELAKAMADAGIMQVSVSVDGLEPTHDKMRAARGSFQSALGALEFCREAGMVISANTNVNRFNFADLEALYEILKESKIRAWQIQLTTPLGRAADRPDMVVQPYDLLELLPCIAKLKERAFADRIVILPGNNLGYFGPEEGLLRSQRPDGADHFAGCTAGKFVMGIESNGAVKGCPSLQSAHYVGGSLKEKSLESIWNDSPELGFARSRTTEDLWGFCKTCDFADVCLGGCTFTAHALMGRPGNNPYCHFRARSFAKNGLRERLVLAESAPGEPFDNARFDIVVEPLAAPETRFENPAHRLKKRLPLLQET